jgi:DNA-binding response OmpR family regulator
MTVSILDCDNRQISLYPDRCRLHSTIRVLLDNRPQCPDPPIQPYGDLSVDIFLAEDDSLVQEFLIEVLQFTDLSVTAASSGDEAAVLLSRLLEPPRLLLTDINLGPGVDGFTLGARARHRWPSLPVIYISGVPMNLTTLGGARVLHPFQERFLQKPFHIEVLLATVHHLIIETATIKYPRRPGF